MGDCIASILHLAGTRYWPSHKGCILFFEASMGENLKDPFPIERTRSSLSDLRNIGVLDEICGLIIGRPYFNNDAMREEFAKVGLNLVEDWDFPVLMNVDVGHIGPMLTIPLNAMSSLDSSRDEFCILEGAVV